MCYGLYKYVTDSTCHTYYAQNCNLIPTVLMLAVTGLTYLLVKFINILCLWMQQYKLVLCNTWNWSDNNGTVSGITILDTTAIPEMRSAISMSFRIRQSQYSVYSHSQTVAVIKIVCMRVCTVTCSNYIYRSLFSPVTLCRAIVHCILYQLPAARALIVVLW